MSRFLAIVLFFLSIPFFLLFFICVKLTSSGPFIFKQKRMGRNMKIFIIYKIRTMVLNAENMKNKYKHLNEYNPPIFKIHNDPRYTKIGKYLANVGLDEIPQLVNVIKGEMSFIGPRPLPVTEALKIPKKYSARFTVLPGIIPPWVIDSPSALETNRWLQLELNYLKHKSFFCDLRLLLNLIKYLLRNV